MGFKPFVSDFHMTTTNVQFNLLSDLQRVSEQLSELSPAHPYMPGLFRRFDGIIKNLYRTGLTRDQIDFELDRL